MKNYQLLFLCGVIWEASGRVMDVAWFFYISAVVSAAITFVINSPRFKKEKL